MITYTYDRGWGSEWPLKQMETTIVNQYTQSWIKDSVSTAVINSTWFQGSDIDEIHQSLKSHSVERVILVSMLDAPIAQPEMFASWPTAAVGYYSTPHEIDFWALFVHQYLTVDFDTTRSDLIDTAFMCLNRKPHWHRKRLYRELETKQLLDHGIVSMGSTAGAAQRQADSTDTVNSLAPNGGAEQHGIVNDIASLGDPLLWQRHFLNVVTETIFETGSKRFVSEKIYKPIVGQRPFLVYSDDGAVAWLQEHGFEPYVNDFADITDLNLADPNNISDFLVTLAQQSTQYLQSKFVALKPKLVYNKHNFSQYVSSIQSKINQGITCQI